jgi:hypothetical protein
MSVHRNLFAIGRSKVRMNMPTLAGLSREVCAKPLMCAEGALECGGMTPLYAHFSLCTSLFLKYH